MLGATASMRPSRIYRSPSVILPSLTMRAFLMTVMDMAGLRIEVPAFSHGEIDRTTRRAEVVRPVVRRTASRVVAASLR